jgi:hypothetical protein
LKIRLLRLLPSHSIDARPRCDFITYSLAEILEYVALSPVWGNPNVTQEIVVNGRIVSDNEFGSCPGEYNVINKPVSQSSAGLL